MPDPLLFQKFRTEAASQISIYIAVSGIFLLKEPGPCHKGRMHAVGCHIRVAARMIVVTVAYNHIIHVLQRYMHLLRIFARRFPRAAVKQKLSASCLHQKREPVLCSERPVP